MKRVTCSRCKQRPAVIFISKIIDGKTVPEGLCMKCAMEMNIGPIKQMMESMGITEEDVDSISEQFSSMFPESDEEGGFESGGSPTMPFLQGLFGDLQNSLSVKNEGENKPASTSSTNQQPPKNEGRRKKKDEKKRKFLTMYCTDLTEKAKAGKLDNIIGRDKELERVVQILCRRSKNNPCLIGEPGVGKTAIAEALALRIASGNVPAKLADKEIHLLDLTALVAGTQFRGQFESRIKNLVDEVKYNGNIILFIDEVHNLVGTGDAEGSMNAANILKPALSRGEIQVVGATTFTEYRKNIEKDAALERRFQPVKIEEPSIADATEILIGIKKYYENYHRVRISDELVKKAVILSERYITDRFLPDKAIDLLDEACTCANLRNKAISDLEIAEKKLTELKEDEEELMNTQQDPDYEAIAKVKSEIVKYETDMEGLTERANDNAVTEVDIAKVIELWTGVPSSKIIESDLKKLAGLEDTLKKKVIGQDEAIKVIAAAIKRNRVQISPRRRPASFIFVGPTGVGKTELVKQISAELFSTPETLIRLDMSEFMEKHSVSRIIGSPPGYVGYDEAGQLTEKVRRKPYSVILFDEIEKAHPDVMNILLQILDEGRITDAQGRTVNFENTVIVMTSNAGSEKKGGAIGFGKEKGDATREKVMKALSDFLRPEFIGRVDEVAVFNSLTNEDYVKIAELLLSELGESLQEKFIDFKWTEEVKKYLADKAEGGSRGARDLRNLIRKEIEDEIANIIIDNADSVVTAIAAEIKEDKLVLTHI
ncbi:MAG: ATP-dependent Clp protease ATP-binding subunit [Clostridia bacterium]|nr:ATP-dependent Clp protease ATP-binding subunit [Clostridia bacterium]MBR2418483.1 ATP-dependent Clp protease ATP-binding subunit [Clostridia bacterium]